MAPGNPDYMQPASRHTGGQQGATTNLTLVIEDGVAVAETVADFLARTLASAAA